MNDSIDFKPPDKQADYYTDLMHDEVKYGQVIDIGPIMEKYDFPVLFIMFVIVIVLFKYAGLLSIIKDLWAGIKGIFTYKSQMIMQLKAELETLKNRIAELEKINAKIHTENVAIKAGIAPLILYLKEKGVDNLGLEKFIDQWNKERE